MSAKREREIRTILVATDFSKTAESGLLWAIGLAGEHKASIHLVHGLMLPNQMTDFVPSPPDYGDELRSAALRRLDDEAQKAREAGIEVTSGLLLGLPSQSILEAAESRRVDLIVLGTRGLTGIRHLLLGSTAERVVQRASCPVLSVHPGDIDQHRRIRTVLVPTDFSRDAEVAVGAARDLLAVQPKDTRLVLLHVYHLPFEYTAYGTIPTSFDYLKDVEGTALERLEEMAGTLARQGLRVDTLAREGYPPDVIVEEAEKSKADLIAMGIHGRSGLAHLLLGSTAERVVQHAGCPVLTVRRPKE